MKLITITINYPRKWSYLGGENWAAVENASRTEAPLSVSDWITNTICVTESANVRNIDEVT